MHFRNRQASIASRNKVFTILWLALLASVGIYAVIAFSVIPGSEAAPPDDADTMTIIFGVVAMSTASASMVLPKVLLSDDKLKAHLQNEAGSAEERLESIGALYFPAWLIGVALAESVAIFGLVLAFVMDDPRFMVPFAVVAALLIVVKRPNLAAVIERAKNLS